MWCFSSDGEEWGERALFEEFCGNPLWHNFRPVIQEETLSGKSCSHFSCLRAVEGDASTVIGSYLTCFKYPVSKYFSRLNITTFDFTHYQPVAHNIRVWAVHFDALVKNFSWFVCHINILQSSLKITAQVENYCDRKVLSKIFLRAMLLKVWVPTPKYLCNLQFFNKLD